MVRSTQTDKRLLLLILVLLISSALSAQERIEWRAVEGIDFYRVEIRQDDTFIEEQITSESSLPVILPEGSYEFRIHALDPFGGVAASSDWSPLEIVEQVYPFVARVHPSWILGTEPQALQARISGAVDGERGKSRYRLVSQEGNEVPLITAELLPEERMEGYTAFLWEGTPGLFPGDWDFVMTNPDGREARVEKALLVLESIENDWPRNIQLHWNGTFPYGDNLEYQKESFLGGSIVFAHEFRGRKIRQRPGFRNFGWNIGVFYNQAEMESSGTPVTINADFISLNMGLHYGTPFRFPVNLIIHASVGVGYTRYTSPEIDRDLLIVSDAGDDFYLKDMDSFDFVFRTGAALRIDPHPRWFLDLGCSLSGSFLLNRSALVWGPYAGGGFRW